MNWQLKAWLIKHLENSFKISEVRFFLIAIVILKVGVLQFFSESEENKNVSHPTGGKTNPNKTEQRSA